MTYNSQEIRYDSPEDITSVDLTIRAASGNISPVIYANGRNQLPVEIIAKAMAQQPDYSERILHFSPDTWINILNLRYAESDEKLTLNGRSGWCFASTENAYSREAPGSGSSFQERNMEPGDELIKLYVYTDNIRTKRIAVSIDTNDGKHFTTADCAAVVQRSSLMVYGREPVNFLRANLILDIVAGKEIQANMQYTADDAKEFKKFKASYRNYYVHLLNGIQNYRIYDYGGGGYYPLRVAQYWANNKNQYMLIANPEYLPAGSSILGFYGNAASHEVPGVSFASVKYDLFQDFSYNDRPGNICWTEFYFETSTAWPLPDKTRLQVNNTLLYEYSFSSWFEFYDSYGNYGAFWIGYDVEYGGVKFTKK